MLDYAVADLAGVYLEVVFFGAYTVLFCICLWVIVNKRTINLLLSTAAITSYVLSAIYVALDLKRVSNSYTIDPERPWVITYAANHVDTLDYIVSSTYIASSLIGDAVLIWRCYAVWGRDIRICVLPILLWFGTAIGASGSVWYLSHLPQSGIIGPVAQRWGKAGISTAIAMNILTTSLIAGRVWKQKRDVEKAFGDRVKHTAYYAWVIAIIIESGATYTACLICELVLYTRNNTGTLLIVGILSQMVGIVPTMIIVYAGLGRGADSTAWTAAQSNSQASQREQGRTQRTVQTLTFDLGRTSRLDPNANANLASLGVVPELGMGMEQDVEAEGEAGKVIEVVGADGQGGEKEGELQVHHDGHVVGTREDGGDPEKVGV